MAEFNPDPGKRRFEASLEQFWSTVHHRPEAFLDEEMKIRVDGVDIHGYVVQIAHGDADVLHIFLRDAWRGDEKIGLYEAWFSLGNPLVWVTYEGKRSKYRIISASGHLILSVFSHSN